MSKKQTIDPKKEEERAAIIASTMMAFDDSVKDAIKEYGKFYIENMYNCSSLSGDEEAQKLVEQYVTNRANKIAEHSDAPGGINIVKSDINDLPVEECQCNECECYDCENKDNYREYIDMDGRKHIVYTIPVQGTLESQNRLTYNKRPMLNMPKESYDPNRDVSLPADIFDINAAIMTINAYKMCGMPALVVGKAGFGYCVFTSGITYEELMGKKNDIDLDFVLYTDGIRITTLKMLEGYEKYYML